MKSVCLWEVFSTPIWLSSDQRNQASQIVHPSPTAQESTNLKHRYLSLKTSNLVLNWSCQRFRWIFLLFTDDSLGGSANTIVTMQYLFLFVCKATSLGTVVGWQFCHHLCHFFTQNNWYHCLLYGLTRLITAQVYSLCRYFLSIIGLLRCRLAFAYSLLVLGNGKHKITYIYDAILDLDLD